MTRRARCAIVAVCCAAGGKAGAQEMRATPGWACPGDTIAISWTTPAARSSLRFAELVDGRVLDVPLDSSMPNRVLRGLHATTVFRLGITADGATRELQDTVEAHADSMTHELRRTASCSGRLSLTTMAIPPIGASERIRSRSVTNRGMTPVWIVHRGLSVRLAPGEGTSAFDTIPFSGDWGVIVDSGANNRSCPATATDAAPPPAIDIVIITGCSARRESQRRM
jgi:hypothetical protein